MAKIVLLFTFWISLLLIFSSCGSDPAKSDAVVATHDLPEALKPLHKEIMALHDEVMPRMSELSNLQTQMVTVLDTLRSREPLDTEELSKANRVLGKLNQAENAMWDWMHNFAKLDSIPLTQKEIFLQSEKSTATSMRDLMVSSLEGATEYLKTKNFIKE